MNVTKQIVDIIRTQSTYTAYECCDLFWCMLIWTFPKFFPNFFQAFIVLFATFQNSWLFATLIEDDTRWWGQYAVLSAALRDRVVGSNSGGGSDRPSRGTPVKRAKWHLGKYFCSVMIWGSLNVWELCSSVLLSIVATLLQCEFKKLSSEMMCIGTYEHMFKKKNLEIYFMYLWNKEIYCTFKTCCIIYVLFSTQCHLCHNFIFFYSDNTFCIIHVQKFKYPPWSCKSSCINAWVLMYKF